MENLARKAETLDLLKMQLTPVYDYYKNRQRDVLEAEEALNNCRRIYEEAKIKYNRVREPYLIAKDDYKKESMEVDERKLLDYGAYHPDGIDCNTLHDVFIFKLLIERGGYTHKLLVLAENDHLLDTVKRLGLEDHVRMIVDGQQAWRQAERRREQRAAKKAEKEPEEDLQQQPQHEQEDNFADQAIIDQGFAMSCFKTGWRYFDNR